MPKRGEKQAKEGELANFPEEKKPTLLSSRYLAVAASLILVFSAFASLLMNQEITGQATSSTMQRWRERGVTGDWESGGLASRTSLKERDSQGRIIVPSYFYCPKPNALPVPPHLLSTSNGECYNAARDPTMSILPMCRLQMKIAGRQITTLTKCVRQ